VYQERNYNFMTDNCHAFVAHFMNELQFEGTKKWNMVGLVSSSLLQNVACHSLQVHQSAHIIALGSQCDAVSKDWVSC